MEYYIITTKDCNLSCLYCYRKKLNRNNDKPTGQIMSRTSKFILSHRSNDKIVTFHGGEPLLAQDIIRTLMSTMEGHNIRFVLYTNGTLLNDIDPWILERLDYLTISIDGEEKLHNKLRGVGTYRNILNNLANIRHEYKGHIMGRMTLPLDNGVSLFRGVMEILNSGLFDSINWQIENTPTEYDSNKLLLFLEQYEEDLAHLYDYWLKKSKAGNIVNILPIQSVMKSLISNEKANQYKCGCGSELIFIDLTQNGKCFACDELIDSGQFEIGDIYNGVDFLPFLNGVSQNGHCAICDIRDICGGRCLRSSSFSKERFQFYCKTVKIFVRKAEFILPEVNKLLLEKKYGKEKIFSPAIELIEGIP